MGAGASVRAIRAARNQRRDFVGDGKLLFNDACDMAKRCVGAPQFIRIFDMNLAFAVITQTGGFRIPGNTAVKSAGVSAASADTEAITRYGATRTPQSAMKRFSAARSCAIARQGAQETPDNAREYFQIRLKWRRTAGRIQPTPPRPHNPRTDAHPRQRPRCSEGLDRTRKRDIPAAARQNRTCGLTGRRRVCPARRWAGWA